MELYFLFLQRSTELTPKSKAGGNSKAGEIHKQEAIQREKYKKKFNNRIKKQIINNKLNVWEYQFIIQAK